MRAFIGLGSNLGDRRTTLERAIALLDADDDVRVVAVSELRETDPVGYLDQPRFLNGAALVETELSARALLERLLAVERELGRVRDVAEHFGPRSVDLDLLLYGSETIAEPGLAVPHPRLEERRFALEPLVELDPALSLPDGRRVRDILGTHPGRS